MKRVTTKSALATLLAIIAIIMLISSEDCDDCYTPNAMAARSIVAGFALMIGIFYFTKKYLGAENLVFDLESLPIIHTDEATPGVPFCGYGDIQAEKTIISPYTQTPCVYYHSIQEYYQKSDNGGHWVIEQNIADFTPFKIKDEKGSIWVDISNFDDDFSNYQIPIKTHVPNPNNSEIDCIALLKQSHYAKLEDNAFKQAFSRARRRTEYVLLPGSKVFTCGMISKRDNDLYLHEDKRLPLIISTKTQEKFVQEFYQGGNLVYWSYLIFFFGLIIITAGFNHFFNFPLGAMGSFLFLAGVLVLCAMLFSLYNRMIALKNRAINALSNIDIELKRRFDLIPQLITIVKAYSKYEQETQLIITQARAQKQFTNSFPSEQENAQIPALVAVIEKYPELKAVQTFDKLMAELVDTEERIAYSRAFYNKSVFKFNTLIQQFPFVIVSSFVGFKTMPFLTISHQESQTPNINI